MANKKTFLISVGIIIVLMVLAYANHFDNGFHFDDSHTVVDNVHIRSLKNIPQFFSDPTMFSVSPNHWGLRPLVTTSLAIDYWLAGGLYTWMFQLSTFLWHIGLCIMLYFMYRQLLSKSKIDQWVSYIALAGAAWFGLHTVNAETLNYIIARSDVLSTFFIVASFLMYVAYPEKRKYGIYILLALIGVFAKETVPVLPIFLFFYIILFEKNLSLYDIFKRKNFGKVINAIVILLPIVIAIAATQLYTLSKMTTDSKDFGMSNPTGYYILTQSYVWWHYFRSFFLPYDLSADTDLGVISNIFDWRIILGILFVIALLITIFKTSKKPQTKPISFGLIWFAGSLLPTSMVPFAEVMNDHRMYFAFVGLTLSVVTALALIVFKNRAFFEKGNRYKLLAGGIFLIFGLNAFGVFERNRVWDTEESLWKDVTQKSPENGRGWMNYGLSRMSKGDYKTAIEAYKRAQITNPSYSTLYINFGIAYAAINDSIKAVDNFTRAIVLAPDNYDSYAYFARYFLRSNKFSEAKSLAEKAIALNSNSYLAREVAMGAYQGLGMWKELEDMAIGTLVLVPGDAKSLKYLKAAKEKKASVNTKDPYDLLSVSALINLSLEQYKAGDYDGCIASCNQALIKDPTNADAYNNICSAYNMLKEWDKAIEACQMALKLNPNHSNAPSNLKWAIDHKN